jgi:FlaA1/EpsC-like NDP-sugar epimerase
MLEYAPHEALRVNICGSANLMDLAREFQVERFVFISTDKAVNPSSVMGASKRIGELMLHASAQAQSATLFTGVRFGNVLGSRGSVVPTFTRQIQSGGPITVTDFEMTRYFMTIPEAANLIIHAACITDGDDIFLLRMGETVKILDLAERMIRMRGLRPYVDIDIVATGVRPGEKLHEELSSQAETLGETAHPGILQIKGWHGVFDGTAFWKQTEHLIHLNGDGSSVLSELLTVIQHNQAANACAHSAVERNMEGPLQV